MFDQTIIFYIASFSQKARTLYCRHFREVFSAMILHFFVLVLPKCLWSANVWPARRVNFVYLDWIITLSRAMCCHICSDTPKQTIHHSKLRIAIMFFCTIKHWWVAFFIGNPWIHELAVSPDWNLDLVVSLLLVCLSVSLALS